MGGDNLRLVGSRIASVDDLPKNWRKKSILRKLYIRIIIKILKDFRFKAKCMF
jgi:hypothetical protein